MGNPRERPQAELLGPGLPHGLYVIGLRETVRGDLFETRRDSLALARKISHDLASQHHPTARL